MTIKERISKFHLPTSMTVMCFFMSEKIRKWEWTSVYVLWTRTGHGQLCRWMHFASGKKNTALVKYTERGHSCLSSSSLLKGRYCGRNTLSEKEAK